MISEGMHPDHLDPAYHHQPSIRQDKGGSNLNEAWGFDTSMRCSLGIEAYVGENGSGEARRRQGSHLSFINLAVY